MKNNLIQEFIWRGFIKEMTPGIEDILSNPTTAYVGFDPTSDSLHIGNLLPMMMMLHFQNHGHTPILLIGGATGMIGDPSGKSEERKLIDKSKVESNILAIKSQMIKFFNDPIIFNNYDWYKDFNLLDFLREVGKHITVNTMINKESVQRRIDTGISFTEFTYQLIQGYDFAHLRKKHDCKIQIGGSDQWGNIISGIEMIRKMNLGDAHAIVSPLITKPDGGKFGKTEKGNIWIDPNKTTPYDFYQFWFNVSDEEARKYIKLFTMITRSEIESIEKEHDKSPNLRILQKELAKDLTIRIHSKEEYENCIKLSDFFFGNGTTDQLKSIDKNHLNFILNDFPKIEIEMSEIESGINIVDLLNMTTLVSKRECRTMINSNSISINKNKISDTNTIVDKSFLIYDYIFIQKGRKNNIIIKIKENV